MTSKEQLEFSFRWARACYRLNKSKKNRERLLKAGEKRMLGNEKRR